MTILLFAGPLVGPAGAVPCAADRAPAATLLFPFVAVDTNRSDGFTTVLSIINTSPDPQIVRLTLWSDIGLAVAATNLTMGGYDMFTVDMHALLVHGQLPAANPSPADGGVRADGPVRPLVGLDEPTGTHGLGDRCDPTRHPAAPAIEPLPESARKLLVTRLQMSQRFLRAHSSCPGELYSTHDWFEYRNRSDPTWMWVTADVVWTCTSLRADRDPNYWRDGRFGNPQCDPLGPQRMTDNVLIGDVTYLDRTAGTSASTTAVHIEADPDLSVITADNPLVPGRRQSFALRHSSSHGDTRDLREPLPTAWAFRFEGYSSSDLATHLQVWIGSSTHDVPESLFVVPTYNLLVAWDDIPYTRYAWDEDENVIEAPGEDPWPGGEIPPGLRPNMLPLTTQEVSIDQFFPLPGENGWMLLVFPHANGTVDPCDNDLTVDQLQTWIQVRRSDMEHGHASVRPGAVIGNANCFPDQTLPDLGVNYDYVTFNGPGLPDRGEDP